MGDHWPIHTVVFDLDDTLYPECEYVLSGFTAVSAWLEQECGISGFATEATRLFFAGSRGKIFNETLARLGRVDAPALVPRLVDVYRKHIPKIALSSEAIETLDWARANFRLALISDGYLEAQERKAAALGLEHWIDCLVFSDRWGRDSWKPSERPFREVMARLRGEAGGYVYISDNPRKDFIAPRRLGWRTLRMRRAGGEHADYRPTGEEAAEFEIDSLSALKGLLDPVRV